MGYRRVAEEWRVEWRGEIGATEKVQDGKSRRGVGGEEEGEIVGRRKEEIVGRRRGEIVGRRKLEMIATWHTMYKVTYQGEEWVLCKTSAS